MVVKSTEEFWGSWSPWLLAMTNSGESWKVLGTSAVPSLNNNLESAEPREGAVSEARKELLPAWCPVSSWNSIQTLKYPRR